MSIILIFMLLSCLVFFFHINNAHSQLLNSTAQNDTITEFDIKIIEYADPFSIEDVLLKMRNVYKNQGKDAIIQTVPALIKRVNILLNKSKITEAEGEQLMDYIWALSVTVDHRIIPVFLKVISKGDVLSLDTPIGFYNCGRISINAFIDSLSNNSEWTKSYTSIVLKKMAEIDSLNTYFNADDKKSISLKLIELLKDKDGLVRRTSIRALAYFGDDSTIEILEKIIKTDTHVLNDGIYANRIDAKESIDKIKKRLMK
jgi:hypothetical protein